MARIDVDRIAAGDVTAVAALLRALDDELPEARAVLGHVYALGGRAFVVGVTGSPGVGKSTLVSALVAALRARDESVAVVAIDPSSPFSGGALLGDRVRMQRHATDDRVFIRSLATRGHTGGLSRSTIATVAVLDAAGYATIFVETVGAGQAELAVADLADAVLVVTAPGLGDEVQALKAGMLEIADLLVVNKGDREGSDRALAEIHAMLALGARPEPALVLATATTGDGVGETLAALDQLRAVPDSRRARGRRDQALRQVLAIVGETARESASRAVGARASGALAATIDEVAARTLDPWTAAERLTGMLK
jgi:GTPase